MNQCILIDKIVDISAKNSDRIDAKIAIENEDVQIFTIHCLSELAKPEYYHTGDMLAVKVHLLMSDEVYIIAEKIAAMLAYENRTVNSLIFYVQDINVSVISFSH